MCNNKITHETLLQMEWRNQMKDDDAVKESFLEPQTHAKYFQSRQAGCPDYDMLLVQ